MIAKVGSIALENLRVGALSCSVILPSETSQSLKASAVTVGVKSSVSACQPLAPRGSPLGLGQTPRVLEEAS